MQPMSRKGAEKGSGGVTWMLQCCRGLAGAREPVGHRGPGSVPLAIRVPGG